MNSETDSAAIALVTGATGLLGSHIVERLRQRRVHVRALCRLRSDTRFLESVDAEIVRGDLADGDALRRACDGVDIVYHAAAKVGDWGRWSEFLSVSVDGTRNVVEAAADADVRRFLHVSSISAYGHVNDVGRILDEHDPLGVNLNRWSYYSRAKVEAERIVWAMHASGRLPVSVIRPSWLYGPRDRATMPRLMASIRNKKIKLIGSGNNRLNVVHAGNVAEACILAAQSDLAIGEAYNVCHDGTLTQKDYFNMIASALGEPEITRSVPYGIAYSAAFLLECFGHIFRTKNPPFVTRYTVWLMGRRCFFECQKIKDQLGWTSRVSYQEGIERAVQDHLLSNLNTASAPGRTSVVGPSR